MPDDVSCIVDVLASRLLLRYSLVRLCLWREFTGSLSFSHAARAVDEEEKEKEEQGMFWGAKNSTKSYDIAQKRQPSSRADRHTSMS